MKNGFFEEHWRRDTAPDKVKGDWTPAGGVSCGRGFAISWQNGALGAGPDRKEPNGAFVEDLIGAVIGRIEHYQSTKFACVENTDALHYLRLAAEALNRRTHTREEQGVEGTHELHDEG